MKSIFDEGTRLEVIGRIRILPENSVALWGEMNLFQMLKHCTLWDEMMQGKKQYKRMFMGRLLGRSALKTVLKDEAPLRRSTPSHRELIIKEKTGNVSEQKAAWISQVEDYANFSNPNFIHVFFGRMTEKQIGEFVYKHIDHHLRQFGG